MGSGEEDERNDSFDKPVYSWEKKNNTLKIVFIFHTTVHIFTVSASMWLNGSNLYCPHLLKNEISRSLYLKKEFLLNVSFFAVAKIANRIAGIPDPGCHQNVVIHLKLFP